MGCSALSTKATTKLTAQNLVTDIVLALLLY